MTCISSSREHTLNFKIHQSHTRLGWRTKSSCLNYSSAHLRELSRRQQKTCYCNCSWHNQIIRHRWPRDLKLEHESTKEHGWKKSEQNMQSSLSECFPFFFISWSTWRCLSGSIVQWTKEKYGLSYLIIKDTGFCSISYHSTNITDAKGTVICNGANTIIWSQKMKWQAQNNTRRPHIQEMQMCRYTHKVISDYNLCDAGKIKGKILYFDQLYVM